MQPESSGGRDVRMRGFARRTTVEAALTWIDAHAKPLLSEPVPIWRAAGRVLAADVVSSVDVPGFARSMMDGFALHAADTLGAAVLERLQDKSDGAETYRRSGTSVIDPDTMPLIAQLTRRGHRIGIADDINFEYGLTCILDHASRLIDEGRSVTSS